MKSFLSSLSTLVCLYVCPMKSLSVTHIYLWLSFSIFLLVMTWDHASLQCTNKHLEKICLFFFSLYMDLKVFNLSELLSIGLVTLGAHNVKGIEWQCRCFFFFSSPDETLSRSDTDWLYVILTNKWFQFLKLE